MKTSFNFMRSLHSPLLVGEGLGVRLLLLMLLIPLCGIAQSVSPTTRWHWNEGQIVVDTPKMPADQQTALGLTLPKMETVRVAFVGLGMRGPGAVERMSCINGVDIKALCNYDIEGCVECQKYLRQRNLPPADMYSGEYGYKALCERNDIDLVYVTTDWNHHVPVAKYALEHGKNVVIEVPAAENLEQIWDLINLAETKRLHCMMLENCCYDWYEMNTLNMAQHGVFGEILRAEGAYIHNLDPFWDEYWKDPKLSPKLGWRLTYNRDNRGDIYATHGLGPVAQALDIHRGDRFTTLVAMDTKSVNGKKLVEKRTGEACDNYRNGDHTTTLMRTANGKVVEIQHNTVVPQPYNRLYKLTGTKGYATKYPEEKYALNTEFLKEAGINTTKELNDEFMPDSEKNALVEKYYDPILLKYGDEAKNVGGHGGMDFIMDSRLVYCLQNGLPLDMDVYDLAEWCCLAELGTLSMDHNCASVAIPDFTRGHWQDKQGYRHAFATPEQEAETEAKAKAFTENIQQQTIKNKLWEKWDKKQKK